MSYLKKYFFAFAAIFLIFLFFGCQDVIYDNIRKEVTLEDGTVAGSIRSIVRYNKSDKEYFYISNGGSIYRKDATKLSYGGWENMSPNGLGDYILQIAADKDCLYALVAKWEENTRYGQNRWYGRYIYSSSDGGINWSKVVEFPTSSSTSEDRVIRLFCTNTISSGNRKAYYNFDGKVYALNGTGKTEVSSGTTKYTKSCASIGSNVCFFNGYAACTNETSAGGDQTAYYYSDGSTVYFGTSSGSVGSIGAGSTILSLAVTNDYLLVGTTGGIKHFKFNSNSKDSPTDINSSKDQDFSTNAAAIMTSAYEVNTLLVVAPEKNETETAIYSSVDFDGRNQQFDHICIWAYYPGRGNWNRD